jgi:hypothetical protein
MLLNVFNIIYLCIWVILLFHCLRNNHLYPIFGNGFATKVFWIFTFSFFNPLMSLLYILCITCPIIITAQKSRSLKNPEKQKSKICLKRKRAIPALIFTYTLITMILFEIPRNNLQNQPVTILTKINENAGTTEKTLLKSGLNIGIISAKNKIQTVSSNSATDNMKVCLRNIKIINKNNHPFLHQIALNLQISLAKLPYVETITYYSYGQEPVKNDKIPEILITLEMSGLKKNTFLLSHETDLKIDCEAISQIPESLPDLIDNTTSSGHIVPFKIQSELLHTSKSLSIECPGTEYQHEVKNISGEITRAITTQFENLLDKYEMLSEPPEKLYGSYTEHPEF